jgi:hypothetical protein
VLTRYWIVVTLVAAFAGCAKLNLGGNGDGPLPAPSTSPSSSPSTPPTPTICGTPSANANLVVVAVGNDVGPTSAPKYGTINGYAVVESGSFSGRAMLINQWLNQGVVSPITSKNVLQFTNIDSGGVPHSAVGFKGSSFPPVPYTFPSAAASPAATAASTSSLWSTGRIAAPVSEQCYSQTFTLSAGVYYFGDLDYYNLSNFRDVLIVATPPPATPQIRLSHRSRGR